MKVTKLLSLVVIPFMALSLASCNNGTPKGSPGLPLAYIKVVPSKLEFDSSAGSKETSVNTTFTFIEITTSETWCTAELNDDNTVLTVTVTESNVVERDAIVTLTGTTLSNKVVTTDVPVIQNALADVKIPIIGAKPDSDETYSESNAIENAWDVDDEGNGNPGTWWLTPGKGNTFPYDVVFLFDNAAKMDYMIYTPKQHNNAANINGCLGKAEVWWTSDPDPSNADHSAFTKIGDYDWGKSRQLPGRTVVFSPALENVTGVKLRMLEAGGSPATGGGTETDGWVGIGDIQFWKLGAGNTISTLDVSPGTVSFGMDGGSEEITVSTSEDTFEVSKEGDWFEITTTGNKITVTAVANNGKDDTAQSGSVTVQAGSLIRTIPVSQTGPSFSVSPVELIFRDLEPQVVTLTTNLDMAGIEVEVPETDEWCSAVLNRENKKITVTVGEIDVDTRTTTITIKAANGMEKTIDVTQTRLVDTKLTVTGATPASDAVYNSSNSVDKAYDGDPGTWWLTPGKGNVYPYDFIFHVAADQMDYLIYTAKQHSNSANVNGCLGKVKIYYTSSPDPASEDAVYTQYGDELDWEKKRTPAERKVDFVPALTNVTGIKLQILEPGANVTGGGGTETDGWAGIGDMSFFKKAD